MSAGKRVGGEARGRAGSRKGIEVRRRMHRLAPGVLGICFVMVFAACALVTVPSPGRATSVAPAGPDCIKCPDGVHCYPNCSPPPPPPPTCNGPPTINSFGAVVQSGYRQAWVNWTYTIPSSGNGWAPDFSWYLGSTQLSSPLYSSSTSSASVNLNDLASGTTYSYTVGVTNCGGGASKSGTFTTSNAPTNEFVGWVSTLSANSYELDQVGSPISGATVWINAFCEVFSDNGGLQAVNPGPINISSGNTVTSSSGSYTLSFPQTESYDVYGSLIATYTIASTGVCTTSLDTGGQWMYTNSHYLLYADAKGYWNETRWISSTLSASNDYQPFVDLAINPNTLEEVPLGLAFVHSNYAQCGFSMYSSSSSTTVSQLVTPIVGTGTSQTTSTGSWANGLTTWGSNNGVNPIYPFSGVINETSGKIMNTYTVGGFNQNVNTVPYWSSDWLSQPAGMPAAIPTNYHYAVLSTGYDSTTAYYQFGTFSQGSYSSWQSHGVQFDASVGGAFGVSTPLVNLGWTDQVSTSSANSMFCNLYAPIDSHGGYGYFYWFNEDSGVASEVTHVWFEGYCGGSNNEPACPGAPK
jgi:hypothetical protein